MKRILILILAFIFSLSLVTLAYSQSNIKETLASDVVNSPTSGCPVGAQGPANAKAKKSKDVNVPDKCSSYSSWVQGVCNCLDGVLKNRDNRDCQDALKNTP